MRIVPNSTANLIQMGSITGINGAKNKLKLWPRQLEYLEFLRKEPTILMGKTRQVLGTSLTGFELATRCMLLDDYECAITSVTTEEALVGLKKVKDWWESLPQSIKSANPLKSSDASFPSELYWPKTKSFFYARPPHKGESRTLDAFLFDEGSKISHTLSSISLETAIKQVRPALRHRDGQLIIIFRGNGFEHCQSLWRKANAKENSYKTFFFGCFSDPTFSPAQREQVVRDDGEDAANEMYPRNDTEMFVASGSVRFSRKALTTALDRDQLQGELGDLVRHGPGRISFCENSDGFYRIITKPQSGRMYVIGVDPLQGIEVDGMSDKKDRGDWCAAVVLDVETQEEVTVLHCRLDADVFAEEVRRLAEWYHGAFVAVERNAPAVLIALKKIYRNLYYQEDFDPTTQQRNPKLGWMTTSRSKPIMIAHADKIIRETILSGKALVRSPELITELFAFVKWADGTCSAQDGCHDDVVMAWLIALQACLTAPTESQNKTEKEFAERIETEPFFEGYRPERKEEAELLTGVGGYFNR